MVVLRRLNEFGDSFDSVLSGVCASWLLYKTYFQIRLKRMVTLLNLAIDHLNEFR